MSPKFIKCVLTIIILFSTNSPAQNRKLVEHKYDNGEVSERYYIREDSVLDGDYTLYDEEGKKFVVGNIKNGFANSKWIQYYSDGSKRVEGYFNDGLLDGIWYTYLPNGSKLSKTAIKNGVLDGEWSIWYITVNENHIIFTCGDWIFDVDPLEGFAEQWLLTNPISKKTQLLKAKGSFRDGIPSGRWTIFRGRLKEKEIIYNKISNEKEYALYPSWQYYDLLSFSSSLSSFSLKEFCCYKLPEFPSFIMILYDDAGKPYYKVEYKNGEKIFGTKNE